MKDRQAIFDYGFEHATSLRGKYTRKGRFLCNMYTSVGYAKPSVGPPVLTIPMVVAEQFHRPN